MRTPRGDRLARVLARLSAGQDFDAVLCGARLSLRDGAATVHREPGEQKRGGLAPLRLEPGRPAVWDGRYEITVGGPGLSVVPAHGRLGRLSSAERATLSALPPADRVEICSRERRAATEATTNATINR